MNLIGLKLPFGTGFLSNRFKGWFVRIWSSEDGLHAVWMEIPLLWIDDDQHLPQLQAAARDFSLIVGQELLNSQTGAE